MKTLIVGDIHGCYSEFQELLARTGITEGDAIIALGDIVDRGPETPQVLDFFKRRPNARSLMGNHERKHVQAARGQEKLALSQEIACIQIGETYPEAVAFMKTFPTWIELPEAILVHGYLEPGIPLEQQLGIVLCGTEDGEEHLRTRYDHRLWYELYTGDKPVIVGHHDYLKNGQAFVHQERVFGLDTGCVIGKTLTGLILPDFTIFSVPSRGNHWSSVQMQHRHQGTAGRPGKSKAAPDGSIAWDEESEKTLREVIELAARENQRILARLYEQFDFANLTPRQQTEAYAAEIGNTPLAALLHMARKDELDPDRVRKVVKSPAWIRAVLRALG